jgi:uncharacterized protein
VPFALAPRRPLRYFPIALVSARRLALHPPQSVSDERVRPDPATDLSMSEFKLVIDRLTDRPQRFEYEAPASWWSARTGGDGGVGDAQVERPFRFTVSANRMGESVLIEGELEGGISVECSRCTRRYAHALRDSFRLVLEPFKEDPWGDARAQEAIDPEGERAIAENGICLGDDLEAGWFRGPVIFLDDLFAEAVATAMPIQPLCEEECPGLCPHCGMERRMERDRGLGSIRAVALCECADERVESPFAVLASWQGQGKSESSVEKASGKRRSSKGSGSGNR